MTNSRRKFLTFGAASCLSLCLPYGLPAFSQSDEKLVSVDEDKVAIQGYDTVAYFTDGKAVKGSSDFQSEWLGAKWRFASAAHRDLFTKRPDAYAPRFGGFCAGGIAENILVRPDPEAWVIVDHKLYLNSSKDGLVDWKKDTAGNIARADVHWDYLHK